MWQALKKNQLEKNRKIRKTQFVVSPPQGMWQTLQKNKYKKDEKKTPPLLVNTEQDQERKGKYQANQTTKPPLGRGISWW